MYLHSAARQYTPQARRLQLPCFRKRLGPPVIAGANGQPGGRERVRDSSHVQKYSSSGAGRVVLWHAVSRFAVNFASLFLLDFPSFYTFIQTITFLEQWGFPLPGWI